VERACPGERVGQDPRFVAENPGADPLDPAGHFGGGVAREGHQQDTARIGLVDDQMPRICQQDLEHFRSEFRHIQHV
jgi:hypothetical protein